MRQQRNNLLELLDKRGITVDQLAGITRCFAVTVKLTHAAETSVVTSRVAFDVETGWFLILDAARYEFSNVSAKTANLFAAMNMTDSDNDNKTYNYLLVAKQ